MKVSKYVLTVISTVLFSSLAHAQISAAGSPTVLAVSSPMYPANALVVRANGEILVNVEIDASGKVASADAISGHKLMQKASEEAARRWQFAPAINGEKKRKVELTFIFRIMDKKTSGADLTPIFFPPFRVAVRAEPPKIKQLTSY